VATNGIKSLRLKPEKPFFQSRILEYHGLRLPGGGSNPGAPTNENRLFDIEKPVFQKNENLVSLNGANTNRRGHPGKPLKSLSGYPYRPAAILPADEDITKTWFVVFYVWDLGKQQMVRKRVLKSELNSIPDLVARKRYAEQMIEEINYHLKRDMVAESEIKPQIVKQDFRGYSVIDAITYARTYKETYEKVKTGSLEEYDACITVWKEFFKHKAYSEKFRLRDLNETVIQQFFEYLKTTRGNSNKTHNNRRANMHAVVEVLKKKDTNLFAGVNPFASVPILQTDSRKHAAYTDDQVQAIINSCAASGEHHLVLFIQYMFYSLARPDEICQLKVGHLRMDIQQILFLAKNAKTSIEQYIGVNNRFNEIITQSGVLKNPSNYYIFSNDKKYYAGDREISADEFKAVPKKQRKARGMRMVIDHHPGLNRVGANYFYKRIKKHIAKLGLYEINPNYTLYSFKHTGAISLYMATRDIKLLQRQLRHQNIDQTNNYLRDLGVFESFEKLNEWKGPA
jgi:integrase